MPYSESLNIIKEMKPILDALMNAQADVVLKSPAPKKLAYLIHNAFHVIKKQQVKDYEGLDSRFKVQALTDAVKCVRIISAAEILPNEYEFTDKKDSLAIVSAAIGLKGSVKKLTFKAIDNLTAMEVTEWAISNGYIPHYENDDLTLTEG
jgi:hypothetical protein